MLLKTCTRFVLLFDAAISILAPSLPSSSPFSTYKFTVPLSVEVAAFRGHWLCAQLSAVSGWKTLQALALLKLGLLPARAPAEQDGLQGQEHGDRALKQNRH